MVSSGSLKGEKDVCSLLVTCGFFLNFSSPPIHCKALGVGLGFVFYLQDHGMATWKGMQIPKTGDGVYGIIIWTGSSNEKKNLTSLS